MKKYAYKRKQTLSLAARKSLAIDWEWSNVDILIKVTIKNRLSAWTGTPRTQTIKKGSRYTGVSWEPDRDITQAYVPGLDQNSPDDPGNQIWQRAFAIQWVNNISI